MDQQPQTPAPDVGARIEEIFRAFETKGAPAATQSASYAFEIQGESGGRHLLRVGPDGVRWEKDYAGEADVRVRLSVDDFLAIADGTFDGRLAVASERIEIEGDLTAAEALLGSIEPEEP
jgi:putative sterol carrier protein